MPYKFLPDMMPTRFGLPYAFTRHVCQATQIANTEAKKLGGIMSITMQGNGEAQETGEQRLWRAVIASTVEEWINGPLRKKREAEQFLFQDNEDYRTVCYSAGFNPEDFRCRLEKIRARQAA